MCGTPLPPKMKASVFLLSNTVINIHSAELHRERKGDGAAAKLFLAFGTGRLAHGLGGPASKKNAENDTACATWNVP